MLQTDPAIFSHTHTHMWGHRAVISHGQSLLPMGLPLILQLVQPNGSSWSVPFHYLDNGKLGRKAVGTTGETKTIPTNMLRFTTALGDRWKQMVARKTDEPLSPRKKNGFLSSSNEQFTFMDSLLFKREADNSGIHVSSSKWKEQCGEIDERERERNIN